MAQPWVIKTLVLLVKPRQALYPLKGIEALCKDSSAIRVVVFEVNLSMNSKCGSNKSFCLYHETQI